MICSIIVSLRKNLPQVLRVIAKAAPPASLANRLRGPAKARGLSRFRLLFFGGAGFFDFLANYVERATCFEPLDLFWRKSV